MLVTTLAHTGATMAAQAAADLELAIVEEHAGLFQRLQSRQAALDALRALVRAHHANDPAMLAHVQCLEDGVKEKEGGLDAVGSRSGLTPLLTACLNGGDAAGVEMLLAFGADPAAEGDVYDTVIDKDAGDDNKCKEFALTVAARDGHHAIAKMLLAHAAVDVNQATSDTGSTALYACSDVGNANICRLLLAEGSIDVNKARTDDGATPLFAACWEGHVEIITMLLAHGGVDVQAARTDCGDTALHVACDKGHTETIKVLLAHAGIDANVPCGDDGRTPLYAACWGGHADATKLLLAHPAIEVNKACTDDGATPLFVACLEGYTAIVKLLLAHDGVEVNKVADDGATPFNGACNKGHTNIIRLMLADGRADIHKAEINEGSTPLHAAALHDDRLLTAQLLVVHGASLTARNHDGETPAEFAASCNQPELAEWLNAVAGWSPLRVAAGCRLYKVAARLLRQGKMDPDAVRVQECVATIAASTATAAALPWHGALPVCKATTKLVADATRGWHRTTHWLHHQGVREVVFAVMVIVLRLSRRDRLEALPPAPTSPPSHESSKSTPAIEGPAATTAKEAGGPTAACAALPVLPIEIWLFLMRFFMRSWWSEADTR